MESKYAITILNKRTGALEAIDYRTGEKVGVEGEGSRSKYMYTPALGEAIANLVREGWTLTRVSRMNSMPDVHVIYRWLNVHKEFKEEVAQARKDRADFHNEETIDLMDGLENLSKDEVPAMKLAIDTRLKVADRGDPDRFQTKPQQITANTAPTMIVINTGIDRTTVDIGDNDEENGTRREELDSSGGSIEAEYTRLGSEIEGLEEDEPSDGSLESPDGDQEESVQEEGNEESNEEENI